MYLLMAFLRYVKAMPLSRTPVRTNRNIAMSMKYLERPHADFPMLLLIES